MPWQEEHVQEFMGDEPIQMKRRSTGLAVSKHYLNCCLLVTWSLCGWCVVWEFAAGMPCQEQNVQEMMGNEPESDEEENDRVGSMYTLYHMITSRQHVAYQPDIPPDISLRL
jgi:hypothetical protein